MGLIMAGIDYHTAPIAMRERFSFSEKDSRHMLEELSKREGIRGCVLLVTCNRTELYLSTEPDFQKQPSDFLMEAAQADPAEAAACFFQKKDDAAVIYLMEVACGLYSQILHEEQIVTQVNQAISLARSCQSADPVLDCLFRTAVSAGKYAQTNVQVAAVPVSVSYRAIQMLEQHCGSLAGKTGVVVGNGKMGRLAAELLAERKCQVYVTLRTCHRGETIVPFGTVPIPYEERFSKIDGADFVITATRSPHFTITAAQLNALQHKPAWIVDLALPRDVEPECHGIDGVQCSNLDDFGDDAEPDPAALEALREIACQYASEFRMWQNYRDAVPYIQQLKELSAQRLLNSTVLDPYQNEDNLDALVRLVTEKTIDMVLGGIKAEVTPERIKQCCEKIQDRARGRKG